MESYFDVVFDVPGGDSNDDRAARADEGEVPFNSCNAPEIAGARHKYWLLVHEAGHVFGIGGGQDGKYPYKDHSYIVDSVMNYGAKPAYRCSPTPYDVMAIYALYQTVDDS